MDLSIAHEKYHLRPIDQDPSEALAEACRQHAHAVILFEEDVAAYRHARLVLMSGHMIRIHVFEPTQELRVGTSALVFFSYRGESRAFFSTLVDHRLETSSVGAQLALRMPSELFGHEARRALRVPVDSSKGLSARVSLVRREGTLHAIPLDLSLTGILLEFGPEEDPELQLGTMVEVGLRLGEDEVTLPAEVRRRAGHRYGLMFAGIVKNETVHPPPALERIAAALKAVSTG